MHLPAISHGGIADRSADILSPVEWRTILCEWNSTEHPLPAITVPELFAAQAANTPNAVAVLFGQDGLTYNELDDVTSRLADRLRRAGVGPDVLVGISLERSIALVVGLLAIMKAGGAFLPLIRNILQSVCVA